MDDFRIDFWITNPQIQFVRKYVTSVNDELAGRVEKEIINNSKSKHLKSYDYWVFEDKDLFEQFHKRMRECVNKSRSQMEDNPGKMVYLNELRSGRTIIKRIEWYNERIKCL